jgi:putative DNA primase/helicase
MAKVKMEAKEEIAGEVELKTSTGYPRNDDGNTSRLIALHGDNMRWSAAHEAWFCWNEMCWEENNSQAFRYARDAARSIRSEIQGLGEDAIKAILSWASVSGNLGKIKAALEGANKAEGMEIERDGFDSKPDLLNFLNGTLELRPNGTTVLREHRKTDLLTKIIPFNYVPEASGTRWDGFLDQFLPEQDLREWAQQAVGCSLFGENSRRAMFWAMGPTSSGKSTFSMALQKAFGGYAGPFKLSLFRESQDERHRTDIVAAMPRRIIFASEASSNWTLHADSIKQLTGNEGLQARVAHAADFKETPPAFTPWVVTNGFPNIPGRDAALDRRMFVVPFPHTIAEVKEDDQYRVSIEPEAVLAWAVGGWAAYRKHNLLNPPALAVTMMMEARGGMSPLDVFLEQICEFGPASEKEYWTPTATLWDHYTEYCDTNRIKERDRIDGPQFASALKSRGLEQVPAKISGKSVRVRKGIRLRS